MRTVLIVAAERRELSGLLRRFPSRRMAWPVSFAAEVAARGARWLVVANGAGPRLAGTAADVAHERVALERASFDAAVSVGYCGGLDPALRVADVFVAEGVSVPPARRHPARRPRTNRLAAHGWLASVDRVVGSHHDRRLLRGTGVRAVEMEAGAVAERAASWQVPFYCVRAVTDVGDETFALDFNAARDHDGRFRTSRLLWDALRRPRQGVPELTRLARSSRLASESLGEFLGDCDF